jgi:signal transduction histidine kinase/ActR/RegA family two-component response regulator
MKTKSINFKLLSLMTLAFLLMAVSIILLADRQFPKIIDASQADVYSGKLDAILGFIDRSHQSLLDTLMVEAYEEQFQSKAINAMKKDYYKVLNDREEIYPFIIDKRGTVVIHPKLQRGTDISHLGFIKDMLVAKNGNFNCFYEGQQRWITFKHFEGWDWFVGYTIPLSVKYADSRKMYNVLVSIIFIISTLIISAMSIIITRFTRPIIALTRISSEMAKGNLNHDIDKKGDDEIGVLARSFSDMRDAIRDKIKLTEQQNISLEKEVIERKDAEKSLKQAKRDADNANESKSRFLANMSHEIRTPMNAIVGFSDVLKDEELTEEQTKYVSIISQSASALLQLINDILDFAKMEAGKMETEKIECNIGEIIEHLDSMLRPNAISKNIEFDVIQHGQLPKLIYSDPVRLRQCMINLLNNAIKFTEKGHVYLNISVQNDDEQQYIRFDVEDTGIGIEQEKLERIFNAFSQADGSTTRKYGGTGLGLAITKQLTELLGGKLTVNSTPSKGSTFSIIIPTGMDRNDTEQYEKPDRSDECDKTENKNDNSTSTYHGKVLVAEDNRSNQALIKLLLKKLGLEPVLVEDGQAAVEKAQSEEFDLILMDIQMPIMTGYEATKLIRKNGYMTPIVALTANAMKEDQAKCLQAGCDDYLSKPINRDKLHEVLGKYLISDTHECKKNGAHKA